MLDVKWTPATCNDSERPISRCENKKTPRKRILTMNFEEENII